MTDLNPYEELGVERDADEATIRRAYRGKAKTAHPDAGGTEEAFARVATSLAVLTTPGRRRTFDETGRIEDDRPDNDRAAALQIVEKNIGDIVNAFVNSGFKPETDPRRMNVPAEIASRIRHEIINARIGIEGGEKVLKYLKDVARRFKLKAGKAATPEADPIARGFKLQVDRTEQQLADLRKAIIVHELAITIADAYAFEQDKGWPDSYHAGQASGPYSFSIGGE